MLDLDYMLRVLRRGSVKSCLKLFIALWVLCAVLSYRRRRKLKHTVIFSCTVSAFANKCYAQTSDPCTPLLSCYSKELRTVELLQIMKLKNLLGHYLLPHLTAIVCTE